MSLSLSASKPHYPILDGLRGVAALTVVVFHILEAHATSRLTQLVNHGYLAVDFFFLLSGFVIGYAYDDRWGRITLGDFLKRRLIRLQPMVIMGMLIGAVTFYWQDSVLWPGIHAVPVWAVALTFLIGCTLLPLPSRFDIRGWQEMHPLDGPAWSLLYEYVGNLLYALVVRRFPVWALAVLTAASAGLLAHWALTAGDMVGGWSLDAPHVHTGFARLMFPFFGGLLLFRTVKPGRVPQAFLAASLLVAAVLAFPRVGAGGPLWQNGFFEAGSILILFPLIVYLGASGRPMGRIQEKICQWLGGISYPIYITHYAFIYLYTGWVATTKTPLSESWPYAVLTFVVSIVVAQASLALYDEPVRAWLRRRLG